MIGFLLALVCTLLVMAAVAAVVGLRLPTEREVQQETLLAAEVEDVYALIFRVDQYALWRREVQRIEWLGEREPPRWVEHRGGARVSFEVVESDRPNRIVHRQTPPSAAFAGDWVFELERPETGVGTHLTITQKGTIPNPFYRTFWRFMVVQAAPVEAWIEDIRRAVAGQAGIGPTRPLEMALERDVEGPDSLPDGNL